MVASPPPSTKRPLKIWVWIGIQKENPIRRKLATLGKSDDGFKTYYACDAFKSLREYPLISATPRPKILYQPLPPLLPLAVILQPCMFVQNPLLSHRRRKRGGGGGGDSLPNFTHCLHNELYCSKYCSIVDIVPHLCPLIGEGNHIFVVQNKCSPP